MSYNEIASANGAQSPQMILACDARQHPHAVTQHFVKFRN